ncbi:MAG TPA: hypothetical protein VGI79_11315 [Caulobacteraceae bacterium]|jgi:hypothetical protein
MNWTAFDDGKSLGHRGCENGVIIADEEHLDGARISLERETGSASFAITCGVYDWMVHTRFFGTEGEGRRKYEAMKVDLAQLASAQPTSGQSASSKMITAVNAFVERFP